jgi:hypothetical protein
MKRVFCTLAALTMLIWTCPQAHADFIGSLPSDQEWQLEVTAATPSTNAATVYYLDRRGGSDIVGIMTVIGADPTSQTFPKPGRSVKRIIIEIDPSPGSQCTIRINQGGQITLADSSGSGFRLVLDVI